MFDERYSAPGYAYGTEPNDFLKTVATRIPPGRVLSIADGEGRNGVFLATLGYDVTSMDASSVGMAKAQVLAASRGVHLTTVVADLATYEIDAASWQGIVSIWVHLSQPLRRRVHAQVVRGLAPGGLFVLEAYSLQQLGRGTGGPTSAERLASLDVLQSELAGLDVLHAVELERDIHEGVHHDGRSAVVQVIARKPAG